MQLDPDWMRLAFEVFLAVCAALSAVYAWHQQKQNASASSIAALKQEFASSIAALEEEVARVWEETRELEKRRAKSNGDLRDRVAKLDAAQEQMPTATEVGAMIAHVDNMKETLAGMGHQMRLLNDHIMDMGTK